MNTTENGGGTVARRDELERRLADVQRRISKACRDAGRTEEPGLVVVTKFFPASDVRLLAELGVLEVGENRDQEAAAKAAELDGVDVAWNFIGQLQTNKAKSVARYAAAVQSVDRISLVSALDKAVARENERLAEGGKPPRAALRCLIQVDLREPPGEDGGQAGAAGRGGAQPGDVPAIADAIDAAALLELGGVMAVAPLDADAAEAFDRLMEVSRQLRASYPGADTVSAGMSQDLEQAVAAGATHLRVGSDVLGPRPPLR